MVSPGEFAKLFIGMAAAMEEGFPEVMDRAGKIIQDEAKAMIGNYQTGIQPFADWPQLSPYTLSDKETLGDSPPDNPLLRTGLMRDSIKRSAGPMEARVGSDDPVAVWQELGTTGAHPIPPRSFLGGAAIRKGKEVSLVVWGGTETILEGGSHIPFLARKTPKWLL